MFFRLPETVFRTLLVMEFFYDEDMDWYEVKVFRGSDLIGYVHGYANRGWTPQVNNIWVMDKYRGEGIASAMMSRIESYFGQIPVPGTPIEENEGAKAFWKKYLSGRSPQERGPADENDSFMER
jgi:hypothetical protein